MPAILWHAIGGTLTCCMCLKGHHLEDAHTLLHLLRAFARRLIVPAMGGVAPVILPVATEMHAELIMLGLRDRPYTDSVQFPHRRDTTACASISWNPSFSSSLRPC